MLFGGKVTMLKIISVLELEWKAAHRTAAPRDFHALSFRLKGDSRFMLGKDEAFVKSGDVCYMPRGIGYEMDQGDEHIIVIHFKTDNDEALNDFFSFSPHDTELYRRLFEDIHREWLRRTSGLNYSATAMFYELLDKINSEAFDGYITHTSDGLGDVIEYIHANFTSPELGISALADVYGTGESYFRRIFKERIGTTPIKYIGDLRQKYAEELLRLGYYSVAEVAEKSGFSDPKYFSRFFLKRTGMPPSEIK